MKPSLLSLQSGKTVHIVKQRLDIPLDMKLLLD